MIKYTEREFKSILNVRKSINDWFWDKYGINPYNGCQFGCVYCDSRSEKYNLPTDFENDIVVKKNAGELLEKRLSRARTLLPDVIGIGGTTDPYQRAELRYRNTRRILEVIKKYRYPVHVATKSPIVLRDLDILEEIGKNSWCTVSVTVTTIDPKVARFLERRVGLPEKRFEVIRKIKSKTKNIQVGILFMPIVPFLGDSGENIEAVVKMAGENGADYVLFGGGMTMRDMQALWFLRHLRDEYPELISKYEKLYGFIYDEEKYSGKYEPPTSYYLKPTKFFIEFSEKYGIVRRIKRFIPDDFRKYNYIVSEKLFSIAYERRIRGRFWEVFFWAAHGIQALKESIVNVASRKELTDISGVGPKIAAYIEKELEAMGLL